MEKRVTASGLTRREFMQASLAGCTLLALSPAVIPAEVSAQTKGPFDLPPLPYAEDALAPVISAGTIGFHYGKHHRGYLDNLNGLVRGTPYERMRLEEVIRASSSPGQAAVFNNAAQVWNHTFYWNCLSPNGGGEPKGALADAINKAFGSFDELKMKFSASAVGNFGSGWTWLVKNADGSVELMNTSNAGAPMTSGKKALLTIDVWEHAYYIDYRNLRPKRVETFLGSLVNWGFAEANFA